MQGKLATIVRFKYKKNKDFVNYSQTVLQNAIKLQITCISPKKSSNFLIAYAL